MIVCICNRLSECDFRQAAQAGAPTPEAAYACLGCEVQCGSCLPCAKEVIDEERADMLRVDAKAA